MIYPNDNRAAAVVELLDFTRDNMPRVLALREVSNEDAASILSIIEEVRRDLAEFKKAGDLSLFSSILVRSNLLTDFWLLHAANSLDREKAADFNRITSSIFD